MYMHGNTQNLSSAFNPSTLASVEHTHAHAQCHTHGDRCHTLEQWVAIHSAWGAWGYSALLKGTSATPPAVGSPIY